MSTKPKTSRRQIVTALIDMLESGASANHVARVLAAYLIETRQTRALELYLRDIELAVAKRFGQVTAYAYSASKLEPKVKEQVKRLVKASSGAKEVDLVEKVEPGLIGGIVIKTADAELDGSIRTKLQKLRSI